MLNNNEMMQFLQEAQPRSDEKHWNQYHDWLLMNTDLKDEGFDRLSARHPNMVYDAKKDYVKLLEDKLRGGS